ncbi:killer cell lectin-like receptor subfamily B member 1B allele C [Pyxicephalus adspersus]|uniref:killer cell lectin-like receptor subfamily B member 1B allele C n=1 Tax=Pyxicephalus adspersus TaxID=30357 RepID=UPI003B5C9982
MEDVEHTKLYKKKKCQKPQQTRSYQVEPSTIVYADIKTSRIQLPVKKTKPENTERCYTCRNISNKLKALIFCSYIFCAIFSCSVTYLLIPGKPMNCNETKSEDTLQNILKQLCVNTNGESAGCFLCPGGWLGHRESCYYISSGNESKEWDGSKETCVRMGAHLLVIENQEQQEFIHRSSRHRSEEHFWIGLYRDGGEWRWVNGQPYNTSLFQLSGESSENCAVLKENDGHYSNTTDKCEIKHSWICQKKALKI